MNQMLTDKKVNSKENYELRALITTLQSSNVVSSLVSDSHCFVA